MLRRTKEYLSDGCLIAQQLAKKTGITVELYVFAMKQFLPYMFMINFRACEVKPVVRSNLSC